MSRVYEVSSVYRISRIYLDFRVSFFSSCKLLEFSDWSICFRESRILLWQTGSIKLGKISKFSGLSRLSVKSIFPRVSIISFWPPCHC